MPSIKKFLVAGRVQGVYFRASTREQALRLGLVGYARNLADGRVEVLAKGDDEQLTALEQWLWQGPPTAQVTAVVSAPIAPAEVEETVAGFVTR